MVTLIDSYTMKELLFHQLSLNVKMLEKIWKPDTYFHNGLDSYLHTITRFRLTFPFKLSYFHCQIILLSLSNYLTFTFTIENPPYKYIC